MLYKCAIAFLWRIPLHRKYPCSKCHVILLIEQTSMTSQINNTHDVFFLFFHF